MSPRRLPRWLFAGGSRADRLRDPDRVVAALGVRPGDVVGDLGPGYGHFTLRIARAVEPDGIVYAIDADPATLDELKAAAEERGVTLRSVRVARDRLEIPEPVDLLFVSATYHHIREPVRYFADARRFLRPDGRIVLLESRREGLLAGRMNPHGTPTRRLRREMKAAGYRLVRERDDVAVGHWFAEFVALPSAS